MKHFALLYRFMGNERFLLWISNDTDRVAVRSDGYVMSYPNVPDLLTYAAGKSWNIEDEQPILIDLDATARWVASSSDPVDCRETLNAWNLFSDIASSVRTPLKTEFTTLNACPENSQLYDKLFWGNNLPMVTPKGEQFVPSWSPDERNLLAQVLNAGLKLFASCVRDWRHPVP